MDLDVRGVGSVRPQVSVDEHGRSDERNADQRHPGAQISSLQQEAGPQALEDDRAPHRLRVSARYLNMLQAAPEDRIPSPHSATPVVGTEREGVTNTGARPWLAKH